MHSVGELVLAKYHVDRVFSLQIIQQILRCNDEEQSASLQNVNEELLHCLSLKMCSNLQLHPADRKRGSAASSHSPACLEA